MFADRRVFDAEDPAIGVSFAEAVCLAEAMFGTIGTIGSYTPPRSAAQFKGGGVGPSPAYSYSAAVVEVEVDPATGWIARAARLDRARHRPRRSTRRSSAARSRAASTWRSAKR